MTADFTTIVDAIAAVNEKTPEATALVHDNIHYNYSQLGSYSGQIAVKLVEKGVQHGDSVALCLDRSINAVAAMLGVLKAGAAFVPLDPEFPEDRLAHIIKDANIRSVLCSSAYQSKFKFAALPLTLLEDLPSETGKIEIVNTNCGFVQPTNITPDDRAYIMYTSGSTGIPKGVPISHRALLNYCQADSTVYQLQPSDRTLQFSTLSFDIAIEEIFPPLLVGSTVVIRPSERRDAQIELSAIVEEYAITALHMATGYWHEWVDLMCAADVKVPSTIRLMVVTGEKVSPEHFHRWQTLLTQSVLWANAYGPTETTVSATVFLPPLGWQGRSLPIGKPLPNYTAYILDKEQKQLDVDETGELFIGGASLAEGYLNQPDLTANAFVADPFSGVEGARMYRTGDLARWMADGNIAYAGRIDHQLKIGSYRIEPGEIENAITEHEQIKEAIVVSEEVGNKKTLLAYVALDNKQLTATALAEFLKSRLPVYMVPIRYVFMHNLPKTLNGKVDRAALPDASEAVSPKYSDYQAPVGKVQKKLCLIWCEVLGVSKVGAQDSFVSLGGDSLMAVRTIARIQSDLDFTISTRDFFYLDTVALLAGYIEGKAVKKILPSPVPAYINNEGRQIYTVLQSADAQQSNGIGILMVPPLGNEQRRAQRPCRLLMRNLAKLGYTSLRFDWTGTGNSSGNSGDIYAVEQWLGDIRDAAQYLAQMCVTIDVLAIRTGALLVAQTDLNDLAVRQRYYWDPITSGKQWIEDMGQLQTLIVNDAYRFLRKRNTAVDRQTEFAGITLTEKLQLGLREHTLAQLLKQHSWNKDAHVLCPTADAAFLLKEMPCHIHNVEEENAWTNERDTTKDMKINHAASKLVDLLAESHGAAGQADIMLEMRSEKGRQQSIVSRANINELEEEVVICGDSRHLAGVYTPPSKPGKCEICVLYITAGLLHHVGPTRLHVDISRALSDQHIAGLRFDLSGIGDSESNSLGGYFKERSIVEIKSAMDFLEKKYAHKRFVLLGLCSGADDALATAQKDERVAGVVLLNGYAYKAGYYWLYLLKEFYLPRLLMFDKWRNKYTRLLALIKAKPANREKGNKFDLMTKEEENAVIAMDEDYRYIPPKDEVADIIDTLSRNKVNLYFIYNGSEYDVYTYEGQLADTFPEQRDNPRLKETYIKEADHTFILKNDREKLIHYLKSWFKETVFDR